MLIQSRTGRVYTYNPSSNRLSVKQDEGFVDAGDIYEASTDYDFGQIGMYTIEMTQQCNLRCRYCCYSGEYSDRRQHNSTRMSDRNLDRCVDFIIRHTPKGIPVVPVSFYGGEALLCMDGIKRMIHDLEARCPGRAFEFAVSTNGILLTEDVIDWICGTPNLYVTITIDGSKAMHDRNRVDAAGHGSFDAIMRNLDLFRRKYTELYRQRVRFISTVKSITDLVELNEFWMNSDLLRDNPPQHISTILPNFDKGETVSSDTGKFMQVYDLAMEHYRRGIKDILTHQLDELVKPVRRRNYITKEHRQTLRTCINEPNSCFISSDGKLYVCERFCGRFSLGTLETDFDPRLCEDVNMRYLSRKNRYCGSCWARRMCRRCPVGLNNDDAQFLQYCANEKMQLRLALKYYIDMLEFKKGLKPHSSGG